MKLTARESSQFLFFLKSFFFFSKIFLNFFVKISITDFRKPIGATAAAFLFYKNGNYIQTSP
jgi:hypothetical protein